MRRFYFVYYIILLYSLKIQPVRSVSVVYNVLNVAIAKLFIKPNMLGRYICHVKAARLGIIIGKVYQPLAYSVPAVFFGNKYGRYPRVYFRQRIK